MAAPYIDDAFITAFNNELHLNYEQNDSYFRGLVRTDGQIIGEKVRFQKLGGLTMTTKARYQEVPLSIPAHSHADAEMQRYFARVAIEDFDLTALNVNVRSGYASKMAASANQTVDDIIIDAMDAGNSSNYVVNSGYSGNMTRTHALRIQELFNVNELPDDGMRFCAITPRAYAHLMTLADFKDADSIGSGDLPYNKSGAHGRKYRNWLGINWFTSNRLPGATTATCKCYAWHMSAVGMGIANDIRANWSWNNDFQHWSGVCSLQMGAVVIDDLGVFEIQLNDTASIPS